MEWMNARAGIGIAGVAVLLVATVAAVRFLNSDATPSTDKYGNLPAGFDVEVGYLKVDQPVQWTLALGDTPDQNVTMYWVRQPSGDVWAFVARDPHSGCDVQWNREYDRSNVNRTGLGAFKALCSGWVFDTDGRVLFGAAERGLDRAVVKVAENGDDARIDLTKFILGACRESGQSACSPGGTDVFVGNLPPARGRR